MSSSCGIVGLPNVGKSTLFNALLGRAAAEVANYPFCTIDPNVGSVSVPDDRLTQLSALEKSAKTIAARLDFVDIAGLVRGASKGEGLGNQFLAHIREVDAIIHVLRCFEDPDVVHVHGEINPVQDAKTVELELVLADHRSLENTLKTISNRAKHDKILGEKSLLIQRLLSAIERELPIMSVVAEEEKKAVASLQLLSVKPIIYLCNVEEANASTGNHLSKAVLEMAGPENCLTISARIEAEISGMQEAEKSEFLRSFGLNETGLNKVIKAAYSALNLISFFTVGPKEAHSWTIKKGTLAPEAAGVIHTDFEKGFISAKVLSCDEYIKQTERKTRLEGKNYQVQDGDVVHFLFNV